MTPRVLNDEGMGTSDIVAEGGLGATDPRVQERSPDRPAFDLLLELTETPDGLHGLLEYCTDLFDKSVNMGPYTPYGMLPSLVFPGSEGGGGWGGGGWSVIALSSPPPSRPALARGRRSARSPAQSGPSSRRGCIPGWRPRERNG